MSLVETFNGSSSRNYEFTDKGGTSTDPFCRVEISEASLIEVMLMN